MAKKASSSKTKSRTAKPKSFGDSLRKMANMSFGEGSAVTAFELETNIEKVLKIGLPNLERSCTKSVDGEFGLPFGRVIDIFGRPKTGKTTLCLEIARSIIEIGGVAVYIDQERTLQTDYILSLFNADQKIIEENFVLIQPSKDMVQSGTKLTVEEIGLRIYKITQEIRKWNKDRDEMIPVVIIWDSVSMTPTEADIKKINKFDKGKGKPKYNDDGSEAEKDKPKKTKAKATKAVSARPGAHASVLRAFFREHYDDIAATKAMLVLVSQQSSNIGFAGSSFLGKDAISFSSSLVLQVARKENVESTHGITGIRGNIIVKENKTAAPGVVVPYQIDFGRGYNMIYDIDILLRESKLFKGVGKLEVEFEDITFEYARLSTLQNRLVELGMEGGDERIDNLFRAAQIELFSKTNKDLRGIIKDKG